MASLAREQDDQQRSIVIRGVPCGLFTHQVAPSSSSPLNHCPSPQREKLLRPLTGGAVEVRDAPEFAKEGTEAVIVVYESTEQARQVQHQHTECPLTSLTFLNGQALKSKKKSPLLSVSKLPPKKAVDSTPSRPPANASVAVSDHMRR